MGDQERSVDGAELYTENHRLRQLARQRAPGRGFQPEARATPRPWRREEPAELAPT